MKKDPGQPNDPARAGSATAADNRVAQRNQRQSQAAQLSAANVEESPHMDQGESAGGSGESLGAAPDAAKAADALRRGALDTQYGTKSSMKSGPGGRVSSAGSGSSSGPARSGGGEEAQQAPNPGSSEESSGAERDTMTGSRPGSRS